MTPAPPSDALPNQLDKEAIYYDIRKRNEIVLKRQGGNMGGGKPAGGNPFDF